MSYADEQEIREAVGRFYFALNVLFEGELGPMKEVWSHADDVTYMGPGGGLRVGWEQVLADWKVAAAMKLGGTIIPEDMHMMVAQDIAVVQNYENGQNTNAGGKTQQVSIRVTNLFRKEDGQWKMVGHHTDLLPFL